MQLNRHIRIFAFTVGLVALGSAPATAGYTITDLAHSPNYTRAVFGNINNSGEIVGAAVFPGDPINRHAAVWRNGVVTDLGTPGFFSGATDINDKGVIAGAENIIGPDGLPRRNILTWTNGVRDLLTPPEVFVSEEFYAADFSSSAINNAGLVVGQNVPPGPQLQPVLWSNGSIRALSTEGFSPLASAGARHINDLGQMAGWAMDPIRGVTHAVVWDNATAAPRDLGTVGMGSTSYGLVINNAGVVAGDTYGPNSFSYAALWDQDGTGSILPSLGGRSSVWGINNSGIVVGESAGRAVMWKDGVVTDLNSLVADSGLTFTIAVAINDLGQIVCSGGADSGEYLLTPDATPTPVPAALPLFGSALAALGLVRRRFLRA